MEIVIECQLQPAAEVFGVLTIAAGLVFVGLEINQSRQIPSPQAIYSNYATWIVKQSPQTKLHNLSASSFSDV